MHEQMVTITTVGPVVLAGLLLVAVIVGVRAFLQVRQRNRESRAAIRAWASKHGLQHLPEAGEEAVRDLWPVEDFRKFLGARRKTIEVSDLVSGEWQGRRFTGFSVRAAVDLEARGSHGRTLIRYHYSAAALEPEFCLGAMVIRTAGWLARWSRRDVIDVPYRRFRKRFTVTGTSPDFARKVLSRDAAELLLRSPVFTIVVDPRRVIAYRQGAFSSFDFEDAARLLTALLDGLPESLRRQRRQNDPDAKLAGILEGPEREEPDPGAT